MNKIRIFAISIMLVLIALTTTFAQGLPGPIEPPKEETEPYVTLIFKDQTPHALFDAVFQQVPGWTYTIHPSAPSLDKNWGVYFNIQHMSLSKTVTICCRTIGNISYTLTDKNYLIHANNYVVPEPTSIISLLSFCGLGVMSQLRRTRTHLQHRVHSPDC